MSSETVNARLQHIVLAVLAIGGVCIAVYYFRTKHDLEYVGNTTHLDGSSTVQTAGAVLRYPVNDHPYREASTFLTQHDFARAESVYRSIIEKTPDELAALQGLGTSLFEQRRYEESRETFQVILRQDPHFYHARAGIGAIERVMSRYPEAVAEYSLALKENPTDALSYFGRGVSYFHIGKRAEALSDLNKVQELLPPTAELAIEARTYIEKQ